MATNVKDTLAKKKVRPARGSKNNSRNNSPIVSRQNSPVTSPNRYQSLTIDVEETNEAWTCNICNV